MKKFDVPIFPCTIKHTSNADDAQKWLDKNQKRMLIENFGGMCSIGHSHEILIYVEDGLKDEVGLWAHEAHHAVHYICDICGIEDRDEELISYMLQYIMNRVIPKGD